jgi:multidrug efflux pump
MTSMAFMLGVLPLVLASGASSASQRAIGTAVIGGMLTGTLLSVLFVPIFFVVVCGFFKGSARQNKMYAAHAQAAGIEALTPVAAAPADQGNPHV